MIVRELIEALEEIEVPSYAKVQIHEDEFADARLYVKLWRAQRATDVDTVVITNNSSFPGVQLWPRA